MNERTINEIEAEIAATVPTGDIGKVMDLVDEHGDTYDKMFAAIQAGNLDRVIEIEKLGLSATDLNFIEYAVQHNQEILVFYQVAKGARLDDVIRFAKKHERDYILKWASYVKHSKMGG